MQETLFADPALLFDQHAMHDGDLPRGAAEAEKADAGPGPQSFPERDLTHLPPQSSFAREIT
jgi:hypothetical protein